MKRKTSISNRLALSLLLCRSLFREPITPIFPPIYLVCPRRVPKFLSLVDLLKSNENACTVCNTLMHAAGAAECKMPQPTTHSLLCCEIVVRFRLFVQSRHSLNSMQLLKGSPHHPACHCNLCCSYGGKQQLTFMVNCCLHRNSKHQLN